MPSREERILDAVIGVHGGSCKKAELARTILDVLDGEVKVVSVYEEDDEVWGDYFVFLDGKGKIQAPPTTSIDEAFRWISSRSTEPSRSRWWERLQPDWADLVSATIAILITLLIGSTVLAGVISGTKIDIPDGLAAALTSILGFYFGRAVPRGGETETDDTNPG